MRLMFCRVESTSFCYCLFSMADRETKVVVCAKGQTVIAKKERDLFHHGLHHSIRTFRRDKVVVEEEDVPCKGKDRGGCRSRYWAIP